MAPVLSDDNGQLLRSMEGRIIRIETLLDGINNEMNRGDNKFTKLEMQISELSQEINHMERQLSYWKGGLAFTAVIWPIFIEYILSMWRK